MKQQRKIYKRKTTKSRQKGSFLNRYDFAYTDLDAANTAISQLNRITPRLIKKLEIN